MVVLSSTSVNAMEISLSRVAASSDQEELKEPYVEYGKLVNHLTYFEQNSEYTLSATISDSGIIDASIHYEKESDTIYSYQNSIMLKNNWENRAKEMFTEIKDYMLKNKANLNSKTIESSTTPTVGILNMSVYDYVVNEYGPEYPSLDLGQKSQSGVTAILYESKGYSIYHYLTKYFNFRDTVNDISSAIGLPASVVLGLAYFQLVDGFFQLIYDTGFTTYNVDHLFQKRVEVEYYYLTHISKMTKRFRITFGDPEYYPTFRYVSTPVKYYDYDYNSMILDTGLYNYLHGIY